MSNPWANVLTVLLIPAQILSASLSPSIYVSPFCFTKGGGTYTKLKESFQRSKIIFSVWILHSMSKQNNFGKQEFGLE
ncbi:hypothetical protein L1987_72580 [Smallanthus sonchifolius]|uniref:Uncharacterized protein n=1 Tax=Smallanthus sonchifolius TaxID=185202 RepID=A0ACB9AVL9_9ASTR|nr:hypothetical protein L1987_72580 [Smallanthus sonchifolius]